MNEIDHVPGSHKQEAGVLHMRRNAVNFPDAFPMISSETAGPDTGFRYDNALLNFCSPGSHAPLH